MSVPVDNAELLARVVEGDNEAWSALVDEYGQMVWAVTGNYGLDHAHRADVTQIVWLRLFEKAHSIREPERLPGWLSTVARNESISVVRRKVRHVSTGDRIELTAEDEPLLDLVESLDQHAEILEAFRRLDERCRELLTMIIHELPYTEMAKALDMPIGSIGPTRQRCLHKLGREPEVARLIRSQEVDG